MPTVISNLPQRYDLHMMQGADFPDLILTVKNPDGTLADLTGVSAAAQIRKTPKAAAAAASFSVAVDTGDSTITLSMADTVTAGISCGNRPTDAESLYFWDLDITWADSRIDTPLWGEVRMQAENTRGA